MYTPSLLYPFDGGGQQFGAPARHMRRVKRGYRDLRALYNIKQRLYDEGETFFFGKQPLADPVQGGPI